jgi:hypothetical protein
VSTQSASPDDKNAGPNAAHAIQQKYTLSPLSQIAQPALAPQEVVSAITEFPLLDL